MSYESTLQNTSLGRLLCAGILIFLAVAAGLACGGEDSKPESQPEFSDADLDSLLLALVPPPRHRAPRCQEWLGKQKAAIRAADLDPDLVISVIAWYRAEISEAAKLEGYTTYPLIQRWQTRIHLDSLIPLTVTELTRQPHWPQPLLYHPQRGSGVAIAGSLLENFTDVIRMAGVATVSSESFRELCLGFLEIAFPDPQIIVTDELQWAIYDSADSLARRGPAEPEAAHLAQDLLEQVAVMESVEKLDTLSAAVALQDFLEREDPDWRSRLVDQRFRSLPPSRREGIYRWQVDIADGFSMQVRITVFHYDDEQGFWLQDIERLPPLRSRARIE